MIIVLSAISIRPALVMERLEVRRTFPPPGENASRPPGMLRTVAVMEPAVRLTVAVGLTVRTEAERRPAALVRVAPELTIQVETPGRLPVVAVGPRSVTVPALTLNVLPVRAISRVLV